MYGQSNRIAILGGGPAGCAAALTLRRYLPDLSFVSISPSAPAPGNAPAVGETLSPGIWPLLGYLGIQNEFVETGQRQIYGTASAWGTDQVRERSYLFTALGTGWHLDRSRFDAWLLECVEKTKTRIVRARAKQCVREGGAWQVLLDTGEVLSADLLLDATGRPGWIARQHAIEIERDDALIAEARWYVHPGAGKEAWGTLIEAVSDGWWYSAALPDHRGVAMFMTDRDIRVTRNWEDRLSEAPATSGRLCEWTATGERATRAAHSEKSPEVVGDGWIAAGDAAATFDPISSLGVGFALRSGMEAARVAVALSDQGSELAHHYAASITRIYDNYKTRLRRIYRLEQRWPDSEFWARRQRNAAVYAGAEAAYAHG
jgi:flavin-dependent dehydrogenase